MNAVGGLTLMMLAPSCAAICAAYATTSSAVSPCLLMLEPRGYDQMTSGKPGALASSPMAGASSYNDFSSADPGYMCGPTAQAPSRIASLTLAVIEGAGSFSSLSTS